MTSEDGSATAPIPVIGDRWLDDSHLEAARAVLAQAAPPERVRLAFVGGSLAAGLGHGMSDVDLYLAVEPGTATTIESGAKQGGYDVQINPLTPADLDLIARICEGYRATPRDRWQIVLDDPPLRRALRYAIGTVLVDNTGGQLPPPGQARDTVRRIFVARSAQQLGSLAEDVLGALQVGDRLTALQASMDATECALEGALAAADDLYLGHKFLLRRLARCDALGGVALDIWNALRLPGQPPAMDAVTALVISRLHLAVHLVTCALLDSWDKPIRQFPAFPGHWSAGGPERVPWIVPIRFEESWGFIGPDKGYRSTEGIVRIFRELDGRRLPDVHQGFASDPVLAGTSRELLDTAVRRLVERGVVAPGDDAPRQ